MRHVTCCSLSQATVSTVLTDVLYMDSRACLNKSPCIIASDQQFRKILVPYVIWGH